jgi:adhesin transport system membrane fusion protein
VSPSTSQGRNGFDPSRLPLRSSRLLYESQSYRVVTRWVVGLFVAIVLAAFLPWQQNVQGSGVLSALSPADRPQTLPSRIDGRIERWFVSEGQFVARGTPIVQISEIKDEYLDPAVITRTQEELEAKREAVADKRRKASALAEQIEALEEVLVLRLEQARNRIVQLEAAVAQFTLEDSIAADQFARRDTLFRSPLGLVSLNDLQASRMRAQAASAALVQRRNELLNVRIELRSLEAEFREKVEKARSDRAGTLAEVSEGEAEIAKLRNKLSSLEVRQSYYQIEAPQDGYVVRAMRQGVGEMVKAGEPIVTVQPAQPRQAVELYVRAMDVPLLRPGRKVRLTFDGWPALQFSGWPSVAVGTFGGEVAVIDQMASPDGRFRVLVIPDPADDPWPPQLRAGSGVYGWAMLDTVRVWFEIWRQLNGFPPALEGVSAPGGASAAYGQPAAPMNGGGGKK